MTSRIVPILLGLLCCCVGNRPATIDPHEDGRGTTLYYAGDADLRSFFQAHRCMVTTVDSVVRDGDGWKAQALYPSINFGPGATVKYPHQIRLTNPNQVPVDLSALASSQLLVLLATAHDAEVANNAEYELLGTAAPAATMSWFEDKPEFVLRR